MANKYCMSWSKEWIPMVVSIACFCFGTYTFDTLEDVWVFLDLKQNKFEAKKLLILMHCNGSMIEYSSFTCEPVNKYLSTILSLQLNNFSYERRLWWDNNLKPMAWLQCLCGWCHTVDRCNAWDSHENQQYSLIGNFLSRAFQILTRMAESSILVLIFEKFSLKNFTLLKEL